MHARTNMVCNSNEFIIDMMQLLLSEQNLYYFIYQVFSAGIFNRVV